MPRRSSASGPRPGQPYSIPHPDTVLVWRGPAPELARLPFFACANDATYRRRSDNKRIIHDIRTNAASNQRPVVVQRTKSVVFSATRSYSHIRKPQTTSTFDFPLNNGRWVRLRPLDIDVVLATSRRLNCRATNFITSIIRAWLVASKVSQ